MFEDYEDEDCEEYEDYSDRFCKYITAYCDCRDDYGEPDCDNCGFYNEIINSDKPDPNVIFLPYP